MQRRLRCIGMSLSYSPVPYLYHRPYGNELRATLQAPLQWKPESCSMTVPPASKQRKKDTSVNRQSSTLQLLGSTAPIVWSMMLDAAAVSHTLPQSDKYVYISTYMYIYTHTHLYTCQIIRTHMYMYPYNIHICMYIYICIYTMRIHLHVCIYTHIHIFWSLL